MREGRDQGTLRGTPLDALHARAAKVKAIARASGFDVVGIAAAEPFEEARRFLRERIDQGVFSGMPWFTTERAEVAGDPRNLLPEVRSIISLALSYRTGEPDDSPGDGPRGRVARYAWA